MTLLALVMISNACAFVPTAVKNRIVVIVNKIENDPGVKLSAPEKAILNKYIPFTKAEVFIVCEPFSISSFNIIFP